MKKIITASLTLFLFLFIFSCNENPVSNFYPSDNSYRVTIKQGVWGNVWFWEGDFMPSPNGNNGGKITPVVRKIYIYEATPDSMVEPGGSSFFTSINSNFITQIVSDRHGFFQIELPPGKYSFFVEENGQYYANEWDSEGDILAAMVNENNVTKRQIDITYKAVY